MFLNYCYKFFIAMFFVLLCMADASAHVKWFAPYNTEQVPLTLSAVVAVPYFWLVLCTAISFIFFVVYVDAKTVRLNNYLEDWRQRLLMWLPEDFAYRAITQALIVFFACVWTIGGLILTPELKHSSFIISGIQVFILFALMAPSTAKYAGFAIISLWLYAVANYGLFHLADYIFFLGVAFFLIKGHQLGREIRNSIALVILYLELSWTLQWGSVEKWLYPDWFYPLLEDKPYLSMGFPNDIFIVMAGFIEFTLAFLLITLTGTGFVITAIIFAGIFLLAIVDFGKVDAIGHLMIVVILYLMAIIGPSKLNYFFAELDSDPIKRALKISVCYILALVFFVSFYYGLQFTYNNYLRFH